MKIKNILESNGKFLTKKYIFEKEDKTVEFSYINRLDKHIICVSCMFGCPVGCIFCASGSSYFGNLTSEDMISSIKNIIIKEKIPKEERVLISFMGSGEPLLNIEQIKKVIYFFKEFPNVNFAISVSGIEIERIFLFNNEPNIKIQLSLHNPNNLERKQMIPYTEDLNKILGVLSKLNNEVEINYILLDGINDSKIHAEKLAGLANSFKFPLKINEYHKIRDSIYESSKKGEFLKILQKNKTNYEMYSTDGADIGGACGQFVSQQLK
jgi:23S rRNA (adenine2503-C2)-methyltransferase